MKPVALVSVRYSNEPYTFSQLEILPNGTHELYTAPRELSDEEINQLWAESHEDGIAIQQGFTTQQHYFARAILKKASEK
jgi:hypothetical protein